LHCPAGITGKEIGAAGKMPGRDVVNAGNDRTEIGGFQNAVLDQNLTVYHRHGDVPAAHRMLVYLAMVKLAIFRP
jgi:hypothetical protein